MCVACVPAEVKGFEAREDRIQLELADGETWLRALLVAADGANSPLRHWPVSVRVVATTRSVRWSRTSAPNGRTSTPPGSVSCRAGRWPSCRWPTAAARIVWSLPEAEAQRVLALDDQAFLDELGIASDFRLGRIVASTQRAAFPLKLQLAERYQADRFVLLGDAAHACIRWPGRASTWGCVTWLNCATPWLTRVLPARDIAPRTCCAVMRAVGAVPTRSMPGFDALARIYAWQAPALVAARGLACVCSIRLAPLKAAHLPEHAAGASNSSSCSPALPS